MCKSLFEFGVFLRQHWFCPFIGLDKAALRSSRDCQAFLSIPMFRELAHFQFGFIGPCASLPVKV